MNIGRTLSPRIMQLTHKRKLTIRCITAYPILRYRIGSKPFSPAVTMSAQHILVGNVFTLTISQYVRSTAVLTIIIIAILLLIYENGATHKSFLALLACYYVFRELKNEPTVLHVEGQNRTGKPLENLPV